jgi:iron complex transport system substrate-binding protein
MIALTEAQQERVDLIIHKLKFIEQKPAVACVTALDPLMLGNDQITELVSIAGGAAAIGNTETLLELDPDVIILMPDGYTVEESIKHIDELLQLPNFSALKAVKTNRFYIADAEQFFNNDAENVVDSIELLAEIINPKQFIFGHEGNGWVKFSL